MRKEEHCCDICYLPYLGPENFSFITNCRHFFCKDCFLSFTNEIISNGQVAKLNCPSCGQRITENDLEVAGAATELIAKYKAFKASYEVEQSENKCFCPKIGCGEVAIKYAEDNVAQCQECGFLFCLDCQKRSHYGMPCKKMGIRKDMVDELLNGGSAKGREVEVAVIDADDEFYSNLYLQTCTKKCPNCKASI